MPTADAGGPGSVPAPQTQVGLRITAVALSAGGLAGAWAATWIGWSNLPHSGGCAMAGFAAVLWLGIGVIYMTIVGAISVVAAVGHILIWTRNGAAGGGLILGTNLAVLVVFGLAAPINPGEYAWAAVIVTFGAMAIVSTALLAWLLVPRSSMVRDRVIAIGLLFALLCFPFGVYAASGLGKDAMAAAAVPPASVPLVATARC